MNMTDVVPFSSLELGGKPLADRLVRRRGQDEIRIRQLASIGSVLEKPGGEEEREYGVDNADAAGERVSERTCGGSDRCTKIRV